MGTKRAKNHAEAITIIPLTQMTQPRDADRFVDWESIVAIIFLTEDPPMSKTCESQQAVANDEPPDSTVENG